MSLDGINCRLIQTLLRERKRLKVLVRNSGYPRPSALRKIEGCPACNLYEKNYDFLVAQEQIWAPGATGLC